MKRLISVLLTVSVIISSLCMLPAYAHNNLIEFVCGLDAMAYFDASSSTLTVKGTGDMCFFYDDIPWWAYRNKIKTVIIEEGITSVASVAFLDTDITKAVIASSVETVAADAFSMTDLEEIEFAPGSKLREFYVTDYFRNTPWYKSQEDGAVYLGNMLLEYKGTMPANTSVTVKDGTYAINTNAFFNNSNLVDITVPDSVERIGNNAFYNTAWMNAQPYYEPVYLGKVLYFYNFPWRVINSSDIKEQLVIPEGIVSISSAAFSSHNVYKNISLPKSLEHIGAEAFYSSHYLEGITVAQGSNLKYIDDIAFYGCRNLKGFDFPDSLERIGINCFISCDNFRNVIIPAGVKSIGITAFEPNALDSFTVSEDNPNFCTDENGILYSKDKSTVYASYQKLDAEELTLPDTVTEIQAQAFVTTTVKNFVLPAGVNKIGFEAFGESSVESINIPYSVQKINTRTFYSCSNLKEIEIPKSVKFIGDAAFGSCFALKKAIVPEEVRFISDGAFEAEDGVTMYCYLDSVAYYYAIEKGMAFELLEKPDMAALDSILDECEKLDRDKYFESSLEELDKAVASVDMTITVITQDMVDSWADSIKNAMNNLEYLPADYTAVDEAIAAAGFVERSLYTQESLAKLDGTVASVDRGLDISDQSAVEAAAKAINDAIAALEYLPADYTAVAAAVEKSNQIDRLLYSQSTLAVLDQSIAAVDYTLNITQQSIVDGFAQRILSAVDSLEYAQVILRNEPNGVVVSATAKEIYPTTALTVDMLDPSGYETGNFAVGGNIKSVQYYDINLIREGEKVQPDGTVLVKIRIPDGVKPEKCRVYHVTEDPVDPLVRFSSTLDGNYIVFETDHFSEFAVIEVEAYLEGVSVTEMPSKLVYSLNERVDLSGICVTAVMSDGTSVVITDFDVANVDTSSIGTKTVTLYYTLDSVTKSVSFEITVSADALYASITSDGKEIEEYNKKVAWYKGYSSETLQLKCITNIDGDYRVKWNSDNSKVMVDENGRVTNQGFFWPRKAVITATVTDKDGNVIAKDSITVRFYKFKFQLKGIQSVVGFVKKNNYFIF